MFFSRLYDSSSKRTKTWLVEVVEKNNHSRTAWTGVTSFTTVSGFSDGGK